MNKFIRAELSYDRVTLASKLPSLIASLTDEQLRVSDDIMLAIKFGKGGVFFIYEYGGTGKTYVWNTLSTSLRSEGKIVLNVASSGIASLLLPGGRTAHPQFCIPLSVNEDTVCNIKQGSHLAELLVHTSLIIWDEAPMANKFCFEALDRSLKDILKLSNPSAINFPFGGKVVVFGGDFRQILPVIPRGTREDIVLATINSSYIWNHCKLRTLTRNMRLLHNNSSDVNTELQEFANWILSIGDGTITGTNDGNVDVKIPNDILLDDPDDPIKSIVESTYPSLLDNLNLSSYFRYRAILAPTLSVIQNVNEYMLSLLPGEEVVYYSSDSVLKEYDNVDAIHDIHSTEFLNSISMSGLPNHEIKLKVGAPIILMRNIDKSLGLMNGTRLIVTQTRKHVIQAKVMSGTNEGLKVCIPRTSMTPSDSSLPFTMKRRQFPVMLAFAMTINKSQGQSLCNVGLYLPRPVFTHGQLYVALSRVRSRSGLKILILDQDGKPSDTTSNVVYTEVFNNVI